MNAPAIREAVRVIARHARSTDGEAQPHGVPVVRPMTERGLAWRAVLSHHGVSASRAHMAEDALESAQRDRGRAGADERVAQAGGDPGVPR